MSNTLSILPRAYRIKGKSHIQSARCGVPVREDTSPELSAVEAWWPVPFLATFTSPMFPPGPHSLLGGQ